MYMRHICLFLRNILKHSHKNLMFLTCVPRKTLVITIITKTLNLAFNHFIPSQFLYLEGSGKSSGKREFSVRNKGCFSVLGGDNLFFFLVPFCSLQPNLGVRHEDMGTHFILEAVDKAFLEKNKFSCPMF
jgi:hypothetical protein